MHSITIQNLSVKFGSYIALDNISVNLPENAFISIVGPNGAGKTTLLKVIVGLTVPTNGIIKIFDKEIKKLNPNELGYVPQLKTLDRTFPALSYELVASGLKNLWIITHNTKCLQITAITMPFICVIFSIYIILNLIL